MTSQRITTALLILELVFTGLLFAGTIGYAFNLSEVGISQPKSLDVEFISEEQGLNGSQYSQCSGDLLTLFNGNLQANAERMLREGIRDMLREMNSVGMDFLMCSLSNFVAKSTLLGNRPGGAAIECNANLISSAKTALVNQKKELLKKNFLVNCTTEVGFNAITNTVTDMMQTMGPDGGMAAAVDWQYSQSIRPAQMAQRQWWTILANTDICSWFKDEALDYLGVPAAYIDDPPSMGARGFAIDERAPAQLRWGCTLPKDFDINNTAKENGGYDLFPLLNEPQNNPRGFENMALAEFGAMKAEAQLGATTRLIAGGGVEGAYGACATGPNNECIDYGVMKVVPGVLRDYNAADVNSSFARLVNATGEKGLLTDLSAKLRVRLLDMANAPLDLQMELGPETNETILTEPSPTPSPGSTPTPDPNDPACTGGDTRCQCATGDTYTGAGNGSIKGAILRTIQVNSSYFINGTPQIAVDYRLVLEAVCYNLADSSVCHPHPTRDDAIVLDFGSSTVSFVVISSDGFILTTGGIPLATCAAGAQ